MRTVGDIRERVRAFVLGSIAIPNLGDDDDLFESGIVNSLFALQLMTFIEKTFAIDVEVDDLDIANFQSIAAAAGFISAKKAALR